MTTDYVIKFEENENENGKEREDLQCKLKRW